MNLELVAVEIGDYIKYDKSVNEIDRIAKAVFKFPRQEFPNESITSVRAQLVYDWILSLEDYKCSVNKKKELLIDFAKRLDPELLPFLRNFGINEVDKNTLERFDAYEFHPEINMHCRKLYVEGNHFHSVFEAVKVYNNLVKSKAGISDDGQSLMMKVWDSNTGVLKINPCLSESNMNFHDGIKFLSAGLMSAIRNPTAHEPALHWPISEQDAADILSLVSFLLRQYDRACTVHN